MTTTLDGSSSDLSSSTAPWTITGAIGALAVTAGAAALAYMLGTGGTSTALQHICQDGLGIGGTLLGIAWLRGLKRGHGGFGAVAGSFALPLAMLLARDNQNDLAFAQFNGLLVIAAFAWFAIGHALVRKTPATRSCAFVASICFLLLIIATAAHVPVAGMGQLLSVLGVAAMAFVGIALAFEMPRIKTSRWSL